MKKLMSLILTALILTSSFNYALGSTIKEDKVSEKPMTPVQQIRMQVITKRVEEIKSMDKSQLTRQEKKSLRTELRSLKKEAAGIAAGGVFLSVGALLVVILLLILLL